eukprot:g18080.t1
MRYQKAVELCEDRRSLLKEARSVQFEVLPKYGIEASEKGTSIMAAWIGSVQMQNGIKDVEEKVGLSMHLSRMAYSAKLPLVKKEAKPKAEEPKAVSPEATSVTSLPVRETPPFQKALFFAAPVAQPAEKAPAIQMAKTFLPTLGMPSVRWKMLGAAQPPLCHRFGGKQGLTSVLAVGLPQSYCTQDHSRSSLPRMMVRQLAPQRSAQPE